MEKDLDQCQIETKQSEVRMCFYLRLEVSIARISAVNIIYSQLARPR